MSMSTHVYGFRPPDERWQQMKAVFDASKAAGIQVPIEVESFFENGEPDTSGQEVDLGEAVQEWRADMRDLFLY